MNGPSADAAATPAAAAGPVASGERIAALDALRGFAVLGILAVNIQSFAMIDAAYFNPTAFGDFENANRAVWLVTHVMFDQKFMTIFSVLFGAGVLLMTRRAEALGAHATKLHFRRMLYLFLFGLVHAYVFWHGDILVMYACCGMIVYFFRHRPPRFLLAFGLFTVSIASILLLVADRSMPYWPDTEIANFESDWRPGPEKIEEELAAFRGGWRSEIAYRAPRALQFQTFIFLMWGIWRAGGLMLIGMGLLKTGFLTARRSPLLYLALAAAAVAVGIPGVLYGVREHFRTGWEARSSFFLIGQYNYWASVLVGFGWMALVLRVCQSGRLASVTRPLAAVGRMALSNYLGQTLICTTIFYGHGLGWFGRVERTGQALIVLGVWAFQLAACPLWLRYFRFGPFEWLWRSLTYRRLQPMRRT